MSYEPGTFNSIEYGVVVLSLSLTCAVGFYCSRTGKKSMEHYVLGDRNMTILPITLSIASSVISGAAFVASSQEHYLYGSQFMTSTLAIFPAALVETYIYLPVFYQLRTVSLYEYFDKRFSNPLVRKFVSGISVLEMVLSNAMSLYVPAMVSSQATGLPVVPLACGLAFLCIVYTVSGGLKSVAWSDSLQMVIVSTCAYLFFIMGIQKAGGWSEVLRLNDEGFRLEFFNFNTSPFQRATFWTGFGSFFVWGSFFLSASSHQRFNSLPTQKLAGKAVFYATCLIFLVLCATKMTGFPIYAYYAGCDPVLAKKRIKSYSSILPYFVAEIVQDLPGLSGLFHAGIIAAGFSVTTSHLNTAVCIIYEDVIKPHLKTGNKKSDNRPFTIIYCLSIVLATISIACVFVVQFMGTLGEAAVTLKSVTHSSIFVLFNSGLLFPWVKSTGAVIGGVTAGTTTVITIAGNIWARRTGVVKDIHRVLTTEKCPPGTLPFTNSTITAGLAKYGVQTVADDDVFSLFKLSYFTYQVPGIILGFLVALVFTWLTPSDDWKDLDPMMIAPQMRWLFRNKKVDSKSSIRELENITYDKCKQECDDELIHINNAINTNGNK